MPLERPGCREKDDWGGKGHTGHIMARRLVKRTRSSVPAGLTQKKLTKDPQREREREREIIIYIYKTQKERKLEV